MALVWPAAQHIYLSPHLDDAALSCGGSIYRQSQRGESIAVITVFAASPPPGDPLSPFARSLHDRWHASAPDAHFDDPPAARRAEDRRALAALGENIAVIHHPLPDCIYRLDPATGAALYASESAIFSPVHPADPALAALRRLPPLPPGAVLYAPLAVGGHVDHRLLRKVTLACDAPPGAIRFYEDYPYAAHPGAVESALGDPALWEPVVVPLDEAVLSAKIAAIAEYHSQISTFLPDLDAMAAAIRAYSRAVGGERFWLPADPPPD
jgi:LmbE family N-acetylglucosaminyl deacetylase